MCRTLQRQLFKGKRKYFELSFDKKFKYKVMGSYLPYILEKAKELREEKKVLKLYSKECPRNDGDGGVEVECGGR